VRLIELIFIFNNMQNAHTNEQQTVIAITAAERRRRRGRRNILSYSMPKYDHKELGQRHKNNAN
jgi:hypothetical protein